jgi:1-acyl-sn-glycerol-3-phosphate acyltransferase
MSKLDTKTENNLSAFDRFMGYCSFSIPYFFIALLFFGLPLGLVFFPRSIGLFVTLPYWTYAMTIGRHETRDGNLRQEFSETFFIFRAMRKLLRMEILPPPAELEQAEKKPNAQFLIAEFPHGVWADYHVSMHGLWRTAFPNIFPNIRSLTASVLFRVPIVREWAIWTSCIDASWSVANAALKRGRTVLVRPGGEAEQLRTTRGREIVFLKHRKGFVKLALKHNVPLVPCYIFGASDYHFTWNGCFRVREWLQKRLGVCLPIAIGYWGSMCPLPVKTSVALGKPLRFEIKTPGNPSQEDIDSAHEAFCNALCDLFDKHKTDLGYGDRKLELV